MDTPRFTVSQVTRAVKELLEGTLQPCWVEGEISNFKIYSTSGHAYFTMKDAGSQISCVMWRAQVRAVPFTPEDGMKVLAYGSITVYEVRGQYQLSVQRMQPFGQGALQLAFEQLKKKLEDEGLFDPARKRPIPGFARRVGVVTSRHGAALHDIIQIIRRRSPATEIILYPCAVQGEGAAQTVIRGINALNAWGQVDVMIVGRGGGSIEDLWAFNDEALARTIRASKIPVISAVGHETDFTIADFAADLRAPTPSAAAELAVADAGALREQLAYLFRRLGTVMDQSLRESRETLQGLISRYGLRRPGELIQQRSQRLDELAQRARLAFQNRFAAWKTQSDALREKLEILNPLGILKRGYAVVYPAGRPGRAVIKSPELKPGDEINILFSEGKALCQVKQVNP
jgi:exodeoxyribonuclease VII large subunit